MPPRVHHFSIALALFGVGASLLGPAAQAQGRTCGDDLQGGAAPTGVLLEMPASALNPTRVIEPLQPPALQAVQKGLEATFPPDMTRYLAMKIEGPAKLTTRRDEDTALLGSLTAKVAALRQVEGVVAGQPLLLAIAEQNLADALVQSYVPSYLTEEQTAMYHVAITDKACGQSVHALDRYAEVIRGAQAGQDTGWASRDEVRYALTQMVTLAETYGLCSRLSVEPYAMQQCLRARRL